MLPENVIVSDGILTIKAENERILMRLYLNMMVSNIWTTHQELLHLTASFILLMAISKRRSKSPVLQDFGQRFGCWAMVGLRKSILWKF